RADDRGHAEFASGFGDAGAAAGLEGLQRADRAECHRKADLAAVKAVAAVDAGDIHEHARAEGDAVECQAVAPQRGFGFGAADQIIPDELVQLQARRLDQLVQVQEFVLGVVLHCSFPVAGPAAILRQRSVCGKAGWASAVAAHVLSLRGQAGDKRMAEPRRVGDTTNLLGEGPVWCPQEQALYWVDITAPAVRRWHAGSGEDTSWTMPESVGSLAL